MIAPGEQAPDFTLIDQDGNQVSLADFRGTTVVLVFYPADFSPVCTDQLSVYQGVLGELEGRGVRLLGISVDGAFCHKAFQTQLDITIPLLADFHPKGDVARAYGVWSEDWGQSGRALVMVGADGMVEWTHSSSPLELPGPELIFDALEQCSTV
ncbi:MAG: redoxin domain-containing protein [Thermoleophilaceae bacterium]|nr:redoxin domain-containing protein [Thermoleophilaceae bacterium]